MFAVLFSSFIQAGIFVSIKKYGQHLNALSMNLIPTAIGALFLFIISFLIEDFSKVKPSKEGIFSVVYLGVFASGVTFTVYYWLLKRINMILLSLVAFITPVVAVFLGWIILGEVLKNNQIIGSGFVLTGVLLANLTFNKTSKGD
jgi:putative membrane protein PagO